MCGLPLFQLFQAINSVKVVVPAGTQCDIDDLAVQRFQIRKMAKT